MPTVARVTVVVAASTAAAALALWWLVPTACSPAGGAGGRPAGAFDVVLVRGCAGLGALAVLWLWSGMVATLVAALRGAGPVRGVPAPVRRTVLAACGLALAGGLALAPAHATPGRPDTRPAPDRPTPSVAGLPLPDRPSGAPADPSAGAGAGAGAGAVVVAPGDSLWSIAAARLGDNASDAAISTLAHRIHALNRDLLGPDPDLIHPGQHLRMPDSEVPR